MRSSPRGVGSSRTSASRTTIATKASAPTATAPYERVIRRVAVTRPRSLAARRAGRGRSEGSYHRAGVLPRDSGRARWRARRARAARRSPPGQLAGAGALRDGGRDGLRRQPGDLHAVPAAARARLPPCRHRGLPRRRDEHLRLDPALDLRAVAARASPAGAALLRRQHGRLRVQPRAAAAARRARRPAAPSRAGAVGRRGHAVHLRRQQAVDLRLRPTRYLKARVGVPWKVVPSGDVHTRRHWRPLTNEALWVN